MTNRIGDLFKKIVTEDEIKEVITSFENDLLGEALLKSKKISSIQLNDVLKEYFNIEDLKEEDIEIDFDLLKIFDREICLNKKLLPFKKLENDLYILTSRPQNNYYLDTLGLNYKLVLINLEKLESLINVEYEKYEIVKKLNIDKYEFKELVDISENDDSPIIQVVNKIILNATTLNASDIHIDPHEKEVFIKYRVDGFLDTNLVLPKSVHSKLVNRIKVMAKLDTSELRLPQDGRFKTNIKSLEFDLRVSVLPTINGEKVVLRLLFVNKASDNFELLGLTTNDADKLKLAVQQKYGLILLTGPTGSGKSTSLYSMISSINTKEINVVTVEDPVEMRLSTISQVQVREELGLTFASSLRSILRQDPDVIMIGEIRDNETAKIAVRASLTGHLVLSTIHTNSALESISRLSDMGVEKFLFSSALTLLVAQRLVRKLCPSCKLKRKLTKQEKELFLTHGIKCNYVYSHVGCKECNNTGYKGRIGLFEVVEINREIRDLIVENKSISFIHDLLKEKSQLFLVDDALTKVKEGITSLEEVLVNLKE